jgi:VWFA-related protein
MTLDVVVSDKSGKPVGGLQESDFTLLDNKQPVKIVSFRAGEAGAAKADRQVEIVLLLDEVNVAHANVGFAREQIKKFLQRYDGALPVPMSVAYLTDSGLTRGEAATRDRDALVAGIDQSKNTLRTITRAQGYYGAAERQQLSLKALGQLALDAGGRPGRKLVIWISSGWPLLTGPHVELSAKDQQWIFGAIISLSDGLRQTGVTLYQVDPLGMSGEGATQTQYALGFVKGVRKAKQVEHANLALQVLAVQSGGRVLTSNNDVAGEIASCIADADAYYSIAFDGLPGDGPNEYHALEIKLDKPGLTARTRTGYYAQPAAAPAR